MCNNGNSGWCIACHNADKCGGKNGKMPTYNNMFSIPMPTGDALPAGLLAGGQARRNQADRRRGREAGA